MSGLELVLLGDGRMATAVERAADAGGHAIVGRLGRGALHDPERLAAALRGADAAIDFTHAEQVGRSVAAAAAAGVPLVVGTTGWDPDTVELGAVQDAGVGLVHGPNFSLGVQIFLALARKAARLVDAVEGYDVHLHETHHRFKADHPSGTAVRTAELLLDELREKRRWVLGPGPEDGPVEEDVLYVTSGRVGHVPGSHVVGLEGRYDRLELRHEARGREGFAEGAVRAATWIQGRSGVFTFEEVVADLLEERA